MSPPEYADLTVVGDKGKKIVIHDEGKFDPRSIPLKNWSDYE
jgi:chitin synthase